MEQLVQGQGGLVNQVKAPVQGVCLLGQHAVALAPRGSGGAIRSGSSGAGGASGGLRQWELVSELQAVRGAATEWL